jgi:hypothetical protein
MKTRIAFLSSLVLLTGTCFAAGVNHPDFNVNRNKQRLGDCAFDRDRGLLYIVEYRGDAENDRPLVHVFKVQ